MDHGEFVEILLGNNQSLVQHGQDMGTRISSSSTAVLLKPFPFKDSDETLTWINYPTYSNIYTIDQYAESGTMSTSEVSQPLSLSSVLTSSKTSLVLSKALLEKQDVTLVEPSLSCLRSGESASTWASVYDGSSSHLVNSTITASGDPELKGKKKIRQQELDMDAKRTRAADAHNLSERRRRDRINQKIMALHELIPNSNKVDKASILDEAIEYLKTLQLQIQMMYLQSGLFDPLMMPPAGMQLPQMPTMSPFSPMDMRMGMGRATGLSNGMEMYDSSNVHHFPVPSMQEQFAPGLMGMQASKDFPICGMLGQGLPIPMSMRPSSVLPTKVSSVTELSMPATVLATPDVTLFSSSKNQQYQSTDIRVYTKEKY